MRLVAAEATICSKGAAPSSPSYGRSARTRCGDWIDSYQEQLKQLFDVAPLPSYSTIRRVLLKIDYADYSAKLAKFFQIAPIEGETIGLDGKVLRGSFMVEKTNPDCEPHPAIMLVSAYLVERGLTLRSHQVDKKTNECSAFASSAFAPQRSDA